MDPRFILSKKKVLEQYNKLKNLGVKISYSYKTNREVGNLLQEITNSDFSIHHIDEVNMIKNKKKIWFFSQAWNENEVNILISSGVKNFVVDHEEDLKILLNVIEKEKKKINLHLRMKFREHRIGSGRYFVYGMSSKKINKIIDELKENLFIEKIGIHLHRKSQNTSEWNIIEEVEDSLSKENLERINEINLGGGLPIKYKTYSTDVSGYVFEKIKKTVDFLEKYNIKTLIEPGRFIAGPPIKLETEIIQVYDNIIVLNCSIYNSAIDTVLTNIRLLVENEIEENSKEGNFYLIKGNTPTRDDIFRYKVKLKNPKVGDKVVFLNAGAYNWFSDFCSLKKLKTVIVEDFD